MRQEDFIEKVCTNKSAFATEERANWMVRHLEESKSRFGLNAYHCRFCGKWHIGRPKQAAS